MADNGQRLTVRLTVSPWVRRLRFPLAALAYFGGGFGKRIFLWVISKSCKVEEIRP